MVCFLSKLLGHPQWVRVFEAEMTSFVPLYSRSLTAFSVKFMHPLSPLLQFPHLKNSLSRVSRLISCCHFSAFSWDSFSRLTPSFTHRFPHLYHAMKFDCFRRRRSCLIGSSSCSFACLQYPVLRNFTMFGLPPIHRYHRGIFSHSLST